MIGFHAHVIIQIMLIISNIIYVKLKQYILFQVHISNIYFMHEYLCMLVNEYNLVMDRSDTIVGTRSILGRFYVSRSESNGPEVKYGL